MNTKHLFVTALLSFVILSSTGAQAITTGTYILSNHPDGSAAPPLYGLRLDGLFTGSTDEIYTFDFDHASSAMTLTWDGVKIVIDGMAFGGQDDDTTPGGAYVAGTEALWDIHFEYTAGITQPGGEGGVDDLFVHADNMNFGTISSGVDNLFELEDEHKKDTGLSFQLGDEDGNNVNGIGHRGFDGISGWGWVNHGDDCKLEDCTHISASDWLFTATPTVIPVPAAAWLFGSGLLGLVGVARRRK